MLTTYRLTVKRSSWQLVSPARCRVGTKLTICPTGDFNWVQRVTFTAQRSKRFDSTVFVQSASSRASPWIAMLFTKVWKNPARAPALSPSRDQHLQTAARIVTHGAYINTASTESTESKRRSTEKEDQTKQNKKKRGIIHRSRHRTMIRDVQHYNIKKSMKVYSLRDENMPWCIE